MSDPQRTPVAVIGASGYTGAELLRLLVDHPRVTIDGVYARANAGLPLVRVFPHLSGRLDGAILEPFDPDAVARRARVAFCALPHGDSATAVVALLERGVTVLDLSADFRLRDPQAYAAWYGGGRPHPAPAVLEQAVYGLPERHRARLPGVRLVAVPGCYTTTSILAVAPLLAAGLVSPAALIIDAKSGVSGAGRSSTAATSFAEVGEGIRPYKVAGTHRHTPEIEQELSLAAGAPVTVTFTPQLVPMSRGILACVYATPTDPSRPASAYHDALTRAYRDEPFVTVLPPGQLPDTAHVRGSNRAHVAVALDERIGRVLAMAVTDNLVKGASGQAVQCLNVVMGWPETTALGAVALFP